MDDTAWIRARDLVGHHVDEFVVSEDHGATVDAYELAADGGSPRVENRYRHRDGSLRRTSWVAAPANELVYATGRDVTAERTAQEELEQAQDALRQAQVRDILGEPSQ